MYLVLLVVRLSRCSGYLHVASTLIVWQETVIQIVLGTVLNTRIMGAEQVHTYPNHVLIIGVYGCLRHSIKLGKANIHLSAAFKVSRRNKTVGTCTVYGYRHDAILMYYIECI